ncbi:MAG: alpha/beta hydrolase [Gammaproteobacteria bacterium]|nr:alpha/beta hydrolase [Gammaproteobacteria bacterium]
MNDYRKAFETTGTYLASRGICLIAYDQRGFGETEGAGFWHGSERLGRDLETLTGLLREGCPDCRLFLLGESMGGALILANLKTVGPDLQGAILLAPAVWSRNTMPYYQQAALWVAVHTFPGRKLTGEGLGIVASDNADMLRALGQDPLVIKATRVDVLYGTSNLMDIASGISSEQETSVLFLYGKRDEIIPPGPICQFIASQSLESGDLWSIVLYENGYHMLTRDLQGEQVLQDISHWLDGRVVRGQAPLGQVEAFCADVQGLPDNRGVVIKE